MTSLHPFGKDSMWPHKADASIPAFGQADQVVGTGAHADRNTLYFDCILRTSGIYGEGSRGEKTASGV